MDVNHYYTCKNKDAGEFDLCDFSSLYMDNYFAPNWPIMTYKYARPCRPHYEAAVIKYENPVDSSLLSSNGDDKIQKFNR